jgi:hypothetical protein
MASSDTIHFSRSEAGNVRNCTPCFSYELLGRLIQAGLVPMVSFLHRGLHNSEIGPRRSSALATILQSVQ